MIEETARVIDVRGDEALLETQRQSACQSCSVKAGCGTSTLSKVVGQRSSRIIVRNTLQLKPGDEVVVAIEENALVQGSLLVYLLPLLMMLGAGVVAEWLFAHEGITILATLMGLGLSILVVRRVLHYSGLKQSIQPHLIRRLS